VFFLVSEFGVFGEFAAILSIALAASLAVNFLFSRFLKVRSDVCSRLFLQIQRNHVSVSRAADAFFWLILFSYVLVFSALSVLQFQAFNVGYDFSIADQVIWNSLRGRAMETSITGLGSSWMGTHFAPILLALVPFYAIWDDPRTLLIVQTCALAVTALPLYWFARERLGSFLAAVIAIAFFIYPSLQYINLLEFHDISLAVPLLGFATYFLLKKRYSPFLICLGLALLVREEVAFIGIAFGLVVLGQGRRWIGLGLVVVSLLWAEALLQYVIPFYAGASNNYVIGIHYSTFGNSLPEVLQAIVTKPDLVLRQMLVPAKAEFVLHLLVPLALLPLAAPQVAVLALPTLGYLLLSGPNESSILAQYPAPILPFLFFGAIVGMQGVIKWVRSFRGFRASILPNAMHPAVIHLTIAALLLVASVLSYYLYAPGPLARNFDLSRFAFDANRSAVANDLINQIPSDAAVLTTGSLVSHLAHRKNIYYLPFVSDYRMAEYIFVDAARCWCNKDTFKSVMDMGFFQPVYDANGFFLAQRTPFQHSVQYDFEHEVSLLGYTLAPTETLRGGGTVYPILGWRADQQLDKRYVFQMHIVDSAGHLWARDDREPLGGALPTTQWTVGSTNGDQFGLRLPLAMPAGDYKLVVGVYDPESGRNLHADPSTNNSTGNDVVLATLQVEKNKTSVTASQLQERFELDQPYFVDMAEMRLLGFKSMPSLLHAGEVLHVGVYWRARSKPQTDDVVSVQLLDGAGKVMLEHTGRPAGGTYPTTTWDAGEVLLDWHDLAIPQTLPQGTYTVNVALTDSASGAVLGQAQLASIYIVQN
jgi:uncharacterized membrane protein